MANPHQSLSIIAVAVNGQRLNVQDVSSFNPGGFMRETQTGHSGISFGERPKEASLQMTVKFQRDTDPSFWETWDDATVTITTDTDHVYVMVNAWLTEPPSVDPGSGTASINFVSNEAVLVA